MVPIPVNSSIIDTELYFDILREVNTTRQNPNRLEDVFKICSDLLFAIKFNIPICLKKSQIKPVAEIEVF